MVRRLIRKGGEGGYIRIQNLSTSKVELKITDRKNVDDMGINDIQGKLGPNSSLPLKGKQPFEDENGNIDESATYCYIEGDVKNRFQKDGYITFEATVVDTPKAKPSSLQIVVDHNSWNTIDTTPDHGSPIVLVADVNEDNDMWKIELRVYNNYDTKCWMQQLAEQIQDQPLTQIGIPGTHDSGTYCFDKEKGASPDNDLTSTIQDKFSFLGGVTDMLLSQIFHRLCQCQEKSIKEQLEHGIRYLDLRVAIHKESGEFYTCHGVYCANMKDVMKQINDFLNEHPKEIVILDFNHIYDMDDHHEEFLKSVFKVLGDKAAHHDVDGMSQNSKVKDFWNHNYQALVFYQYHEKVKDVFGTKLWPLWRIKSPWPESSDTDDLYNKLETNIKNRGNQDMDKLFVLQGILTPDIELIKNGLMDGDGLSIKGYAKQCSPKVVDWCEDDWMKSDTKRLNIVIVDFYEGCSMIPALLNYNRRL